MYPDPEHLHAAELGLEILVVDRPHRLTAALGGLEQERQLGHRAAREPARRVAESREAHVGDAVLHEIPVIGGLAERRARIDRHLEPAAALVLDHLAPGHQDTGVMAVADADPARELQLDRLWLVLRVDRRGGETSE